MWRPKTLLLATLSLIFALAAGAYVLHATAPTDSRWTTDVSQLSYQNTRDVYGEPDFTHGFYFESEEWVSYQETGIGTNAKLPGMFYDIWVSGWTVGETTFFPRLRVVGYSHILHKSQICGAQFEYNEDNLVIEERSLVFNATNSEKYRFKGWAHKYGPTAPNQPVVCPKEIASMTSTDRDPLQGLIDHIKNPETRELPIPESVKEEARAWLKSQREHLEPPLESPWTAFPEDDQLSLRWRMGPGEDYMNAFTTWVRGMSASEFDDYALDNPEPASWTGFLERIRVSD